MEYLTSETDRTDKTEEEKDWGERTFRYKVSIQRAQGEVMCGLCVTANASRQ